MGDGREEREVKKRMVGRVLFGRVVLARRMGRGGTS